MLLALLLVLAAPVATGADEGTPADGMNVAALVVDYGDGAVSYALVPFTGDSISGLELLERSGLDLLTISFGGMGTGVCAIQDVGCDIDACRGRMCQTGDPASPFWQYLRAPEESGAAWVFAPRGVSGATIHHGEVNAWFWTGTTPTSAALTMDDVTRELQVDLTSFRTSATQETMLRTIGDRPGSQRGTPSGQEIGIGVAILLGVTGAGGVAIWRSRREGLA